MRHLKFRLWEKELKAMITSENSDQFLISLDGRVFDTGFTFSNQAAYCKDMIAMQFTGLKDKNGNEIYEGDIVKCNKKLWPENREWTEILEVESISCSQFDDEDGGGQDYVESFASIEVIGNIYENPELLKTPD